MKVADHGGGVQYNIDVKGKKRGHTGKYRLEVLKGKRRESPESWFW